MLLFVVLVMRKRPMWVLISESERASCIVSLVCWCFLLAGDDGLWVLQNEK